MTNTHRLQIASALSLAMALSLGGCKNTGGGGTERQTTTSNKTAPAKQVSPAQPVPTKDAAPPAKVATKAADKPATPGKDLKTPKVARVEHKKDRPAVTRTAPRRLEPTAKQDDVKFVGTKIGLVLTANVIGELEPCG